MKRAKKDPKKHGIISVVQSPDESKSKSDNEVKSDNPEGHGIISVVQSPDDVTDKQN
jgi:hypothetical protein